MRRPVLFLSLMVGLFLTAADAQDRTPTDRGWDDLTTKTLQAETAAAGTGRPALYALVDAYRETIRTPEATRGAHARALHTANVRQPGAAQFQLSVIQIAQNERIIELLEELKKK